MSFPQFLQFLFHLRGITPVLEGVIVLLCGILVTFICLREYYLQRTEVARSFINVFNNNQGSNYSSSFLFLIFVQQ